MCTDKDIKTDEIYKNFEKLKLNIVAVRSSAICEDSKENSFAGQFDTILNVNKNILIQSIYKCFNSSSNFHIKKYAEEKQVPKNRMKLSVIVQEMIDGDISGVMFTKNPISEENEIIIEFVKGLGEGLVQGEMTPSQVILDKSGKIKQYLGIQYLSNEKLKELAKIAILIEDHFSYPQDIEWTLKGNMIYILQARPITSINLNI